MDIWMNAVRATAGAAPSGFDRLTIPNLKAWYHADLSPLWQDAGSTPVAANDDPIARWDDLSGNGHHLGLMAGGSSSRPLYKTSAQNGMAGVLFDGVNDILNVAVAGWGQPLQVFVAYKIVTVGAFPVNDTIISHDLALALFAVPSDRSAYLYVGKILDAPGTPGSPGPSLVTLVYDGSSSYVREDGTQIVAGDAGGGAILGLTIGGAAYVGGGGERFAHMEAYEAIVVSPPVSGSDLSDVETALISEWGL